MSIEFRSKLEKIMAMKAGEPLINPDAFSADIRDSVRAQLAAEGIPNPLHYVNVMVYQNDNAKGYRLKVTYSGPKHYLTCFGHFFDQLDNALNIGSFSRNPLNGVKERVREYFSDTPDDLICGLNYVLTSHITKIDPCLHIIGFKDKYPAQSWGIQANVTPNPLRTQALQDMINQAAL